MVTIDTLKVRTPFDSLNDYNSAINWTNTETKIGTEVGSYKSRYNNGGLGFKSVMLDHNKEEIHLEVSAKILRENYHNLISMNSIEQVVDNINACNVIELNKEKFITAETEILKVDMCNNLHVTEDVNKYFVQMLGIRANDKYKVERYNKPKNKGVVIQGNQTSFKERMIAYNKLLDIQKDRALCSEVSYNKLANDFQDVVRVEQNLAQLSRIRHYARTNTTNLLEVLNSDAKPNYELLKKATSKFFDLSLFRDHEEKKLYEIEKIEGRKGIIEKCNYDVEIIREFLQSKVKGNISSYLRQYKRILYEMQRESEVIFEPEDNPYIKELMHLLQVA